jgi:hypothetical protein
MTRDQAAGAISLGVIECDLTPGDVARSTFELADVADRPFDTGIE